ARLPQPIIDALPRALADKPRIYAKDLPLELYDAIWTYFLDALEPLRAAGKLGGVLLQYPRWFLPTPESKDHLAESAARLAGPPGPGGLRNRPPQGGGAGGGRRRTGRSTCCAISGSPTSWWTDRRGSRAACPRWRRSRLRRWRWCAFTAPRPR